MAKTQFKYPDFVKGGGPRDYLKIAVVTDSGQGKYQFFSRGSGSSGQDNIKSNKKEGLATIYLAMPRSLQVSYGMSYQGVELGSLGGGLVNTLAELGGGTGDVTSMATSISSAAANASPEMALNLGASAINAVISGMGFAGGVDANSVAALTQGAVLNPFREITFKGVNYRNHNFTIKMVAHNAAEANEIKGIVNTLRYYMHPSLGGGGAKIADAFNSAVNWSGTPGQNDQDPQSSQPGNPLSGSSATIDYASGNRWLGIPSYFDLAFVRMDNPTGNGSKRRVALTGNNEIKNIYRPGYCVLQSLNVNFSPDGQYVSTKDGYVMAVQIQMSFKETVMLHRQALVELGEY